MNPKKFNLILAIGMCTSLFINAFLVTMSIIQSQYEFVPEYELTLQVPQHGVAYSSTHSGTRLRSRLLQTVPENKMPERH
jgi:hypothetical protein